MPNWKLLGEAPIPGTGQTMFFYQGKDDFSIKLARGQELMNSRKHGSEDALGELPCRRLKNARQARVLVGVGGCATMFVVRGCVHEEDVARVDGDGIGGGGLPGKLGGFAAPHNVKINIGAGV